MIKACIFDLGGTIVDRYSLIPLLSLKKVFNNRGISINNSLIKDCIGEHKKDYIPKIVNHKFISNQWFQRYDDYPDEFDMNILHNDFHMAQNEYLDQMVDVLPETKECINYLNFNYINTGVTTELNKEDMNIIKNKLQNRKIFLDSYISSTCLYGQPYNPSYMIQQTMENLGIMNPKQIIKIDDTEIGIEEGKLAGCLTVGVARWSINMGIITIDDAYGLSIYEIQDQLKNSRKILRDSGADYVIDTLDELPRIIEEINYS